MAELSLDDQVLSSHSVPFKIDSSTTITGSIAVTPAVVVLGRLGQMEYTIHNTGNTDLTGLTVKISVIDPETYDLMATHEETIDLGMNSTRTGQLTVSTDGYELKTYTVNLYYHDQASQKSLAGTSFMVKDGTPPVVTIISPVSDIQAGSTVGIAAAVSDDASGVENVEYQIDESLWQLLPIADVSRGVHGTTWTPTASYAGEHTISLRATDGAGNQSEPVSTTINVVLAPTSMITISGHVSNSDGIGIPGVQLNGFPDSIITDGTGFYETTVESGWSGIVTPQKTDYIFTPSERAYDNVVTHQTEQNYTGILVQYILTIEKGGTGTGIVTGNETECRPECTMTYRKGTVVVLEAIADSSCTFDGWSGAGCSGTGYCTITITGDTTITATFSHALSPTPTPTVPPDQTPTPGPFVIPEPMTLFLLGLGLLGLLILNLRKWRKRL